jgi:hypothetical protein
MDEPNVSHRANTPIADRLHAKMNALAGEPSEGETVEADSGGDEPIVTETPLEQVTTETQADEPGTPEQLEAKTKAARLALFEEKLQAKREENQAKRLAAKAKADRKAAQEDREAAAAERKKYDGLKVGTFKETIAALGRDPRKTWEDMNREMIEASTPEAQARRDKEAAEQALDERFKPLQSELEQIRAEREQLRLEREQLAEQGHSRALVTNFQQAAADPAFKDLRIEYADDALLDHAKHYDKNPDQLRAAAAQYGVRLTAPEKGFTMHELLQVLSAAQSAHNEGVQARRAALSSAEPQSAAPPTVNGTAPRRNAGTAVGNDLASQRASAKSEASGLSPKERVRLRADEAIRRSGG